MIPKGDESKTEMAKKKQQQKKPAKESEEENDNNENENENNEEEMDQDLVEPDLIVDDENEMDEWDADAIREMKQAKKIQRFEKKSFLEAFESIFLDDSIPNDVTSKWWK